jgi:hypothetical protein
LQPSRGRDRWPKQWTAAKFAKRAQFPNLSGELIAIVMLSKSTFVRIVGAQFLMSAGKETESPIPWFVAA